MLTECRKVLIENLQHAGFKRGQIYTSKKKLSICNESRVAAVLFESDDIAVHRSKRIYVLEGEKHKRRKKYDREVSFNVVIGEYELEKVEDIYNHFLEELQEGIYVSGNYVEIVPQKAEWFEDEDTILKSKCAVQLNVVFKGGVYKDSGFTQVSEFDIAVEKERENGKQKE